MISSTNGYPRVHPPGPYRLSRRQVRLPLVVVYVPAMILLSVLTACGALAFSARDLLILALGPTSAVLLVPFFSDDRVRLTEVDVRFRSGFRSHKVRWTDIARLEVRSLFGVRQLVLHTTSGKRRTLPAPHSLTDPGFDDKTREITDWWLQRRA